MVRAVDRRGRGRLRRQRPQLVVEVLARVTQQAQRVAGGRGGVVPPFPEGGLHVVHDRPLEGHLHVVPGRPRPVLGGDLVGLRVTGVVGVVSATVTQVDAAQERDVAGRVVAVPDHDELLVVGAVAPYPHVEHHVGAALLEHLPETLVVLAGVPDRPRVRAPHQRAHVDAALRGAAEHLRQGAAGVVGELLVGVGLPVGEPDEVAGAGRLDALEQLGEVRRPVHQRPGPVPARPGATGMGVVDPGAGVAARGDVEEPLAGPSGLLRHVCSSIRRSLSRPRRSGSGHRAAPGAGRSARCASCRCASRT